MGGLESQKLNIYHSSPQYTYKGNEWYHLRPVKRLRTLFVSPRKRCDLNDFRLLRFRKHWHVDQAGVNRGGLERRSASLYLLWLNGHQMYMYT